MSDPASDPEPHEPLEPVQPVPEDPDEAGGAPDDEEVPNPSPS